MAKSIVLYSTNVFLKLLIQERYRDNSHYVWCSEAFDPTKLPAYELAAQIPASSTPADIYADLRRDAGRSDRHSAKIAEQKASFKRLAIQWFDDKTITATDRDEIIYMADNATPKEWRPLIYVIPRAPVEARLEVVPIDKRAGFGFEYIIKDLKRSEFDVIEVER